MIDRIDVDLQAHLVVVDLIAVPRDAAADKVVSQYHPQIDQGPATQLVSGAATGEKTMSTARWAGVTYLVLIASGIFALAYAHGQLFVRGDAEATFENISTNLILFKGAILAEMVCYASFVALVVLLQRLFVGWSVFLRQLMFGLVLVSVAIGFVAIGELYAIARMLSWGGGDAASVDALLTRYRDTRDMAEIFWGLWLLPYGLLVLQSRAIPWVFGVGLVCGCASYVAGVVAPMFWDGYFETGFAQYADLPGTFGEIGGAFWLTIMGARVKPASTAT